MKSTEKKNQNVYFRASGIAPLVYGVSGGELTESQVKEVERLESLRDDPEGLTEKQNAEYVLLLKQNIDDPLPDSKQKKFDAYKLKSITPKGLTDVQSSKLQELKDKAAKPPELSQGGKTFVKQVWADNEKGFRRDFSGKQVSKGLEGEEDAISLSCIVDDQPYSKNETRMFLEGVTGECDIVSDFEVLEINNNPHFGTFAPYMNIGVNRFENVKVVDDTKCSWDVLSFMDAKLSSMYKGQGNTYMELYDADLFRLRYCLVNCPPVTFADEYKRFCFSKGIIDDSQGCYREIIEQFIRNTIYDYRAFIDVQAGKSILIGGKRPISYPETIEKIVLELGHDYFKYSEFERVKTFVIARDPKFKDKLSLAVELGMEYYESLTLNGINQ